jgi:NagD protein
VFVGYFIDVQGTLIDDIDRKPIEGAIAFIEHLNRAKIPYVLVTNNTKNASKAFFDYLQSLGFAIGFENYIDPLMVLDEIFPPQSVAPYGDENFIKLLAENGYAIDFNAPNAVLVGMKKDFTADEYAQMIELILNGAKLIGMHATTVYAKEGKKYPGIGAIMQMLAYATNCNYEVVGKPSKLFYEKALAKIGYDSFANVTMISDDLVGDLVGIKKLGAKTALVLSGKLKSADTILTTLEKSLHPDWIEKNIGKLAL